MDQKTLLEKLNQLDRVTASCRSHFLSIRVEKFRVMGVDLDSPTYNAKYLPPMPPLEYMQDWDPSDSNTWDAVFKALVEYYQTNVTA